MLKLNNLSTLSCLTNAIFNESSDLFTTQWFELWETINPGRLRCYETLDAINILLLCDRTKRNGTYGFNSAGRLA